MWLTAGILDDLWQGRQAHVVIQKLSPVHERQGIDVTGHVHVLVDNITDQPGWRQRSSTLSHPKLSYPWDNKINMFYLFIKTHHYLISFAWPLHSKPGMESFCRSSTEQLSW